MITFRCQNPNQHCSKTFTVQDEHAGRKANCPICGFRNTVPANETIPEDSDFESMFESKYEPEYDQSSYSSYSSYTHEEPPAPKKTSAPKPPKTPKPQAAYTRSQQASGSIFSSIVSWLLDFAFKDIRVHIVNRIIVCIFYVIGCIAAILCGLGMTFSHLNEFSNGEGVNNIFVIPFVWIGVALAIIHIRLFWELFILLLDWIVETTKAARLYMENCKKESGEN